MDPRIKDLVYNLRLFAKEAKLSLRGLADIWDNASEVTINVLGDPIVDKFYEVEPRGLSKGYPTINWEILYGRSYAGGCLKVACDCANQCRLATVGVANDAGEDANFMSGPKQPEYTTDIQGYEYYMEKNRYMFGTHQMFRTTLDPTNYMVYPDTMPKCDCTILSLFRNVDQISKVHLKKLAGGSLIIVDSQVPGLIQFYKDKDVVLFATKDEFDNCGCFEEHFKQVIIKDGPNGAIAGSHKIPAFANGPKEIDTIGSGDAFLATAAVVLASARERYFEAAVLGSIAAAIHCTSPGNGTVTREEIDEVLAEAMNG